MSTHNPPNDSDEFKFMNAPVHHSRINGVVDDGILSIHDTQNAFGWIELELPSKHAVFNLRTMR
jgi:hypothetical protein